MLGVSLPVVDQLVVTRFASLQPEGSVTYLENANRLMIAAQGVLGQAAAVAAFPYLAAQVATGDYPAFAEFLRSGLRRLLFVALPVSTLMILWAAPLTRLMFGYGLYNTPQNLRETAICLAFTALDFLPGSLRDWSHAASTRSATPARRQFSAPSSLFCFSCRFAR
jgi:putative peptidoglycan lipid II flippase